MPNIVLTRNTYPDSAALNNVISYVLYKAVARGGYGVNPDIDAAQTQMLFIKKAFYQTEALQLKHFFITLNHTEAAYIDNDELLQIGFMTGQLFREYQMVYGVHYDGSHVHLHIVMNTTSFIDGHQYCDGIKMFNLLCGLIKRLYPQFEVNLYRTRGYSKDNPYSITDRDNYVRYY